jgi:hypothetical protein
MIINLAFLNGVTSEIDSFFLPTSQNSRYAYQDQSVISANKATKTKGHNRTLNQQINWC